MIVPGKSDKNERLVMGSGNHRFNQQRQQHGAAPIHYCLVALCFRLQASAHYDCTRIGPGHHADEVGHLLVWNCLLLNHLWGATRGAELRMERIYSIFVCGGNRLEPLLDDGAVHPHIDETIGKANCDQDKNERQLQKARQCYVPRKDDDKSQLI